MTRGVPVYNSLAPAELHFHSVGGWLVAALVVTARERDPGYWGFPLWQHAYSSQHRNLAVVSSHPDDSGFPNLVREPHDDIYCVTDDAV